MGIRHDFISQKSESRDSTKVSVTEWHQEHIIDPVTTDRILTYTNSATPTNVTGADAPILYTPTGHSINSSTALPLTILSTVIATTTRVVMLTTITIGGATLTGGQAITFTLRRDAVNIEAFVDPGDSASVERVYINLYNEVAPGNHTWDIVISGASNINFAFVQLAVVTVGCVAV